MPVDTGVAVLVAGTLCTGGWLVRGAAIVAGWAMAFLRVGIGLGLTRRYVVVLAVC